MSGDNLRPSWGRRIVTAFWHGLELQGWLAYPVGSYPQDILTDALRTAQRRYRRANQRYTEASNRLNGLLGQFSQDTRNKDLRTAARHVHSAEKRYQASNRVLDALIREESRRELEDA